MYFGERIGVNVWDCCVGGLDLVVGKMFQKTPFKTWTFIRTLSQKGYNNRYELINILLPHE